MYDPRVYHVTLKFKVMQKFKDAAECKDVVGKWAFGWSFISYNKRYAFILYYFTITLSCNEG